jgi:DNA-binding winged helix-turn-helix (wHTH) protein
MLLEHSGDVVTREELIGKLWAADTFGDFDHGLNKAINKIREALTIQLGIRDSLRPSQGEVIGSSPT